MSSHLRFSLLLAPALLLSAAAEAQDLAACRGIADDQARLACYDRASAPGSASSLPIASPPPAAAPAAAPPVAPKVNPIAAFGRDPAPTEPADFGRNSIVPALQPPQPPAEIQAITATALQIIDPDGKPKFVLDNGQVWAALNYLHLTPHRDRPNTVTIESAAIGYLLRLNDGTAQYGVKRLK
jgi:hypothetical protein